MFLFVDIYVIIRMYFGIIFVKKEFSFFKGASQRIKSFDDGGSGPSCFSVHHGNDFVPNLFVIVLELSECVEYSQNCGDSATDQSVHVINKSFFEVVFPEFVFFLQSHKLIFVETFDDFERLSKLKFQT